MIRYALILLLLALFLLPFMGTSYHAYQNKGAGAAIVELLAPDNRGGGTGFELEYEGHQYTVTNGHVCDLGKEQGFMIIVSPLSRIKKIGILEEDPYADICFLEPVTSLPALKLGDGNMKKGDSLTILGHPLLGPLRASEGRVLETHMIQVGLGPVEGPNDCREPKNEIVPGLFGDYCTLHVQSQITSALIKPGSSGSPVLDSGGKVRGIAFASNPEDELAEIIPQSQLHAFLIIHTPYYLQPGHHASQHP